MSLMPKEVEKDPCLKCNHFNRPDMCDTVEVCSVKESWYAQRLKGEVERLEKELEAERDEVRLKSIALKGQDADLAAANKEVERLKALENKMGSGLALVEYEKQEKELRDVYIQLAAANREASSAYSLRDAAIKAQAILEQQLSECTKGRINNPCEEFGHRNAKLPPFCPICLADERDAALRTIEGVREWYEDNAYGNYIVSWDELKQLVKP